MVYHHYIDINPRLHSWTKALAILHKKKNDYKLCFHSDSIIIPLISFFLILLEEDVILTQISKQLQVLSRVMGNVFLLHVHLVVIKFSCPRSFCEFPLGLVWPMFVGVTERQPCFWYKHIISWGPTHSQSLTHSRYLGLFISCISLGQVDYCLVFRSLTRSNRAKGEKKSYPVNKRWKYLVWQALCFLSYEKLINIQWLKVNTPFILFTLHPAHSSDCSNFNS